MFKEEAFKNKYLVIGEVHGVKQNKDVLDAILEEVQANKKGNVLFAFEWPLDDDEVRVLQKYIDGDFSLNDEPVKTVVKRLYRDLSGAFSDQYLNFVGDLREVNISSEELNIRIQAFDVENCESWDARDAAMARRILGMSDGKNFVVVVTGQLHAQKKTFVIEELGGELHPLATHLPEREVYSVMLQYDGGEFYNFGLQSFSKASEITAEVCERYDDVVPLKNVDRVTHLNDLSETSHAEKLE